MIDSLSSAGSALLVFVLPGFLLYRLPFWNRAYRASLAWEERAFWMVVFSTAWSLATVLALASLGQYTLLRLLGANAIVSVALLIAGGSGVFRRGEGPAPSWPALVPVGLVMLCGWLYFPPSEYVIGGRDPGTYINEGIQIAQRGAIQLHDPVIDEVPRTFWDLFFPSHEQPWYYGLRFMGFFIQDPDHGDVIGQFPHLYPASIAIGYGLNGLSGARQATGAWATLGILGVYFCGMRLFGRTAAAGAALLLGIHVTELWFARYPNTEVVMQAFLFAALLAFARALDGGRGLFAAASGLLLGLMLFLRYDVVLAFAGVAAAACLAPVTRQRIGLAFGLSLAFLGIIGFLYLQGPMQAYSSYPLAFTRDQVGWWLLGAMALAGVGGRIAVEQPAVANAVRRLLPPALAVAVVGLAGYAYFLREPADRLAAGDAYAFRTFSWYLGPWVLCVVVLASAVAIVRRFWTHPALFLTFIVFSVFFFYKTRIVPEQFWASRRFLAITLPGGLLCLSALARDVVGWAAGTRPFGAPPESARGRWFAGAGIVVAVFALLSPVAYRFWTASAPVRPHVEYAGLIPHLERLAGEIGDRDLLLVESRNASDLHTLAVPLAYIYARQLLVLNTPAPPKLKVEAFLRWAEAHYERVLFLGGGGTDLLTRQIHATPIGGERFQVPEYDAPLDAYPSGVRQKEFEYGLYALTLGDTNPHAPLDLSIGERDDLNVIRFHAREVSRNPDLTYRWTTGQSFVVLTPVPESPRSIVVWMSRGGRPPTSTEPIVEFAIGDDVIGTAAPADDIRPYAFTLTPDLAARLRDANDPLRLRLRVPTWNPAAALGVPDSRDLGVLVTRVEVK